MTPAITGVGRIDDVKSFYRSIIKIGTAALCHESRFASIFSYIDLHFAPTIATPIELPMAADSSGLTIIPAFSVYSAAIPGKSRLAPASMVYQYSQGSSFLSLSLQQSCIGAEHRLILASRFHLHKHHTGAR
ncbi:hypothetical protein [Georgfuchsia toluolica]|uniref:hypothetical protein n=1 Tax=Georgfuchsia toluolica TaxID=424218 RepID=UPI001C7322EF|nr:hypothetical protein [Georgfuchsia toluolica]